MRNRLLSICMNRKIVLAGIVSVLSLASSLPAHAQAVGSLAVKDANAATQYVCQVVPVTGTGQIQCVDVFQQGAQIGSANPLYVQLTTIPLATGAATAAGVAQVNTTLGSPFQAGGSIGNTAFGISGTLPAFAATPTVNIGTMPTVTVSGTVTANAGSGTMAVSAAALPLPAGAATLAAQSTTISTLGSPFQAGGSIGNTAFFAKLQDATGAAFGTVGNPINVTGISGSGGSTPTGTAGSPTASVVSVQGVTGGTAEAVSQSGTWNIGSITTLPALPAGANTIGGVTISGTPTVNIGTMPSVVVSNFPSTQAVSLAALPSLPAGTAQIGTVNTVIQSTAADRGAIIGFTGAQITTASGSNTITLTTAPTVGSIVLGQTITATGVPTGSYVYALASGTISTAGSTYTLSSSSVSLVAANATASGTAVAATSVGPQQIMAANAARRGTSYQVQSSTANVWVNGIGAATADYHSLKVPAQTYYETAPTHTGTGAIAAIADTPATPLYSREW